MNRTGLSPPATFHVELQRILRSGLRELGEEPERAAELAPRLAQLARMTSEWSRRMNLTGMRDARTIGEELVLDPLAWIRLLPDPAPRSVADLGSGAGFPGFPLAVFLPRSQIVMVEARQRRHHFQRAMRRTLALNNATPIWGRIESVPAIRCRLVVTQAVGHGERELRWMMRWSAPGATLAIPRQKRRLEPSLPPGLSEPRCTPYRVPGVPETRYLWTAKRVSLASEDLYEC